MVVEVDLSRIRNRSSSPESRESHSPMRGSIRNYMLLDDELLDPLLGCRCSWNGDDPKSENWSRNWLRNRPA